MKIRAIHILGLAVILAGGAVYRMQCAPPPEAVLPPIVETRPPEPAINVAPPPKPQPEKVVAPSPAPKPEAPPTRVDRQDPTRCYWETQEQRYAQIEEQLRREIDPVERQHLIQALAGYVRIDTLAAIEWAMDLENPEERRAALEAINARALVGIGAQIEMTQKGLPVIKNTTVLSAIKATGKVENGDYIVGMVDETGQPIYFQGRPLQDIVQSLRGESGREIRLLMARTPSDKNSAPYEFDVSFPRSIIVVPLLD